MLLLVLTSPQKKKKIFFKLTGVFKTLSVLRKRLKQFSLALAARPVNLTVFSKRQIIKLIKLVLRVTAVYIKYIFLIPPGTWKVCVLLTTQPVVPVACFYVLPAGHKVANFNLRCKKQTQKQNHR